MPKDSLTQDSVFVIGTVIIDFLAIVVKNRSSEVLAVSDPNEVSAVLTVVLARFCLKIMHHIEEFVSFFDV